MKKWMVTVEIFSLVGKEVRQIEVEAKTERSAWQKIQAKMGNRDFCITETTEAK